MTTSPNADRNLLFGILAVQMDFVPQAALIKAMNAWVLNKSKPLGELLVAQGDLSNDRRMLLEALVEEHLKQHHHDVSQSLAAVSSVTSAREALGQIPDQDVQASLAGLKSGTTQGKAAETLISAMPTMSVNMKSLPGFRYQILRPHAKGGLGEVLVARDQELHREVALKQIQEGRADDPDSQSRFLLEAEITGGLEHPGIVPVYGLGYYDDGRPYYAMRFIRGDSLKEAIARYHHKSPDDVENAAVQPAVCSPGRVGGVDCKVRSQSESNLELRALLRRFIDVCNAIAYAHSRGVLHRDLKPGNIMLGKYGETLVVDWGLAKPHSVELPTDAIEPQLEPPSVSGSAETLMGSAVGTPQYMSPEQAAGRLNQLGPASDVYSLGATLYCLLTGQAPFQGRDVGEMLRRVQNGEFPSPRQIDRRISPSLEAICLRAMALHPEDRYGSPRDLAQDIENWLADEPVSAYHDSLYEQTCRWARRHRPWVIAGTLLLLAALVGLAGSNILINKERERTQEALTETERSQKAAEDALAQAQAAETARVKDQVNALLQAQSDSVPAILASLEPVREKVRPLLQAHLKSENLSPAKTVRIHLALLPDEPNRLADLRNELLKANAEEFAMLSEGLSEHAAELPEPLWECLLDESQDDATRFRAACGLAAFDPKNSKWPDLADQVAGWLVQENPLVLGIWVEMLEPVRGALLPSLVEQFRESPAPEIRSLATKVVGRWASDQMELLAGLLQEADAVQFAALLPQLKERTDEAVAFFQKTLTDRLKPKWPKASDQKPNPEPRFAEQIEQADGLITESFALVQSLPLENFTALVEGLKPAGYRPIRFRPYRTPQGLLVASVWERDSQPFELETSLTKNVLLEKSKAHQEDGFAPVDVAGYLLATNEGEKNTNPERYGAIWVKSDLKPVDSQLLCGLDYDGFSTAQERFQRLSNSFGMITLQSFHSEGDEVRYSAVIQARKGRVISQWAWSATEQKFEINETPTWVLSDVSLTHLAEPPDRDPPFQDELGEITEADLNSGYGKSYVLPYKNGLLALGEGREEQAIEQLSQCIKAVQILPQPYFMRSLAQARLGKIEEAKDDLAQGRDVLTKSVPLLSPSQGRDCFFEEAFALPLVMAHLGKPAEGDSHLREFLAGHQNQPSALYTAARAYAGMSKILLEKPVTDDKEKSDLAERLSKQYTDRAVDLLKSAYRCGWSDERGTLHVHQEFESLHTLPEYQKLLEEEHSLRRYAAIWQINQTTIESQRTQAATAHDHLAECRKLLAEGFRPVAISASTPTTDALGEPLNEASQIPVALSVWQRPLISEAERNQQSKHQANAALALWHLKPDNNHWPLIDAVTDPGFEAAILDRVASLKLPPKQILDRLPNEANPKAKRMLLLALGQYDLSQLSEAERQSLVPSLTALYRENPDAGIHSAAEWLLRKWQGAKALEPLQESLKTNRPRDGKNWYINGQGQTYAVVEGPVTFSMGASATDTDQLAGEINHRVRIERTFAISTTETTVDQYLRFNPNADYLKTSSPDPNGPMVSLDWFSAIKYCRWLSEREGIPEDQMCYPPIQDIGAAMTIPADYLTRTGYRLPTEAEWEYAARAGVASKFSYGDDPTLLREYAWFLENAKDQAHPVGLLLPNRLGLFDAMGNAGEWCHDENLAFTLPPLGADRLDTPLREVNGERIGKGGSLLSDPPTCRLSRRFAWGTLQQYRDVGLRVARTLPPATKSE